MIYINGQAVAPTNLIASGNADIQCGVVAPSSAIGDNGSIYLQYELSPTLPSGYTELEYIEYSGGQYADTGVPVNTANLRVVSMIAITDVREEAIWGGEWATNGYFFMVYQNKFRWHSGSSVVDASSVSANKWYNIETNKAGVIINGVTYTLSNPSTDVSNNLLFGTAASASGKNAYMRQKRTQLYSGDTLLKDYIPAKDSNNVACLYDLVNEQALYSAGTAFGSGAVASVNPIVDSFVKVNNVWQSLISSSIDDVNI